MSTDAQKLDLLCINTIRTLAIDAIQKANSGHPGLPMGAAPMAYVLWTRHLKHNPADPTWTDRDRFVLSAGHGSMLLYTLLHLSGYDLTMADLQNFRQWQSRTPGHPEFGHTPGVEATTGPLGQGSAVAAGMALAERRLAAYFNREDLPLVDHYTYALVSDGDLMEGLSAEAASLAGHLKLGKLIYLYDANDISLDGSTDLAFSEDVGARYEAYGWHVITVKNGDDDLDAIDKAIITAKADPRPSLIIVKTTIGYGSPSKGGTSDAHGSPLGVAEIRASKEHLGWDPDKEFYVPDEALAHFRKALAKGSAAQEAWWKISDAYKKKHSDLAEEWTLAQENRLPEDWDAELPEYKTGEASATRSAGGAALNAVAAKLPYFLGGDADLSCSTKTAIKGARSQQAGNHLGRNIHFGVREHAMAAMANGMAYHGGVRPFTATFFVFSDYMKPSLRLAAMNKLPVIHIWTHDSIGVGEDGPTHQPIEQLAGLRAMPGMTVIRPGDPNEAVEAWRCAINKTDGPVGLVLSRQDLPALDRGKYAPASGLSKGAYVMASNGEPNLILMATGSELPLAAQAYETLAAEGLGVRLVSMPSSDLFAEQDEDYRNSVLPPRIRKRVSIEAASTFGWDRWVGSDGMAIGIDHYGASAPGDELMEHFGFTLENVLAKVRTLL